jgi:hypothetical protein
MRYKYVLALCLVLIAFVDASGQRRKKILTNPDTAQVVKDYMDSLTVLRRQLD